MPFKSVKQKKWMFANKPKLAKEWEDKYGDKIEGKLKLKNKIMRVVKKSLKSKRGT